MMTRTTHMLGLLALAAGGCTTVAKRPPVVYNTPDIIASGRPPLLFYLNRPGALTIFDITAQSRVFHLDVPDGAGLMLKLDAERQGLLRHNDGATQPSDQYELLLPIDPSHEFAVEFRPGYQATPPTTMPGEKD